MTVRSWPRLRRPRRSGARPARPGAKSISGTGDEIEDLIDQLIDNIEALTPWERKFVKSVATRPAESLSPKQKAIIERLARGLRARAA
jgi:hypothetical protein